MYAWIHKIKNIFHPTPFITTIMVLSTLPLLIVMYLTYSTSERSLLKAVEDNLKLIAKYKSSAIDTYIFNLQSAAEALALNTTIIDIARQINTSSTLNPQQRLEIKEVLIPVIDSFRELIHATQFTFISDNEIALSIRDNEFSYHDAPPSELFYKAIQNAKTLMETELYNFPSSTDLQKQIALLAVPIAHQGTVIGAIAIELSNDEIYKIIRAASASISSLEVIVGIWQGNNTFFLTTPLKFDKEKLVLSKTQAQESETVDYLKQAVEGKEQQIIFNDYRGKEVLAVTKYLPALRWGMMIKADISEAFSPINNLRKEIVWMGAITLTLLTLLAYFFSKKLQHSQEMLIQQEKLASIGILTAGVAHEINNPINFITSNIKSLKLDITEVLEILNKYEQATTPAELKEVAIAKKELDLEVSIKEIDTLLKGIEEGAQRTAAIVKDLKVLSRLNEADRKIVDLHEGINSSLILLNHTYQGRIEIIKEYGAIPPIECFAGKINQVILNILSNAIQSIQNKGTIRIKTTQVGVNVEISFKDTGSGISEENKHKIFTPFFTTKDIGEGTGLGLALSYSIIKDHHGKIDFYSVKGKGTEFIITLPVTQP